MVRLLACFPLDEILTIDRLFQFPRKQCRSKGSNDHCRHSQCWSQLFLLLSAPHSVHGLRCGEAFSRQGHVVCPSSSARSFCLWSHLRRRKLDDYAGQCWPLGPSSHPATCSHTHSFLRLDPELAKLHDERSLGEETKYQGWYVSKAVVLYLGQHCCHIWILLPKLIHLCRPKQPRLRTRTLEEPVVHTRWMAQYRVSCRPKLYCILVAADGQQPKVCDERRSKDFLALRFQLLD